MPDVSQTRDAIGDFLEDKGWEIIRVDIDAPSKEIDISKLKNGEYFIREGVCILDDDPTNIAFFAYILKDIKSLDGTDLYHEYVNLWLGE